MRKLTELGVILFVIMLFYSVNETPVKSVDEIIQEIGKEYK